MKASTIILGGAAIVALLLFFGIVPGKQDEMTSGFGGGGGGWAAYGDDSGGWLDNLIGALQQPQPTFENPFQTMGTADNSSGMMFGSMNTLALDNGFSSKDDPMFKAAFLEHQLSGSVPDGRYAVSVPYAPTAAGAQAQINNTYNPAPAPSASKSSSNGGSGFGSAKIVLPSLPKLTPKIESGFGNGGIGGGFGGGGGGMR